MKSNVARLPKKTFSSASDSRQDAIAPAGDQEGQPANVQSESSNASDYENYSFIRQQLMNYARQMSRDLRPNDPDCSLRTLSLSRVLDRIQQLDQILPELAPRESRPPWQDEYEALLELDPSPIDLIKAEKMANQLDENQRGRAYKYYAEHHRKEKQRNRIRFPW